MLIYLMRKTEMEACRQFVVAYINVINEYIGQCRETIQSFAEDQKIYLECLAAERIKGSGKVVKSTRKFKVFKIPNSGFNLELLKL